MSFYSESIYLDLKKNLHGMNYAQLDEKMTDEQKGKYSQKEKEITPEDLGSKAYLFFEEKDLVLNDIKNACLYLKNISQKDQFVSFPFENVVTRVNVILHKYLEQPSLLDNLVEPILGFLIDATRSYLKTFFDGQKDVCAKVHEEFDTLVSVVYILAKVRGTKNVQKYLGHEVMDLEPLIFFMIANHKTIKWESLFFLLMWLSVVLLAPFDFARFDFTKIRAFYAERENPETFEQIELLILDFLKSLLRKTSRIAEVVSLCFSVLFRRPDMANVVFITDTVQWGVGELSAPENLEDSFYKANIYKAMAGLVKDTKREVLELFYKDIFEELEKVGSLKATKDETGNVRYEKAKFVFTLVNKLLRPNSTRPIHKTQRNELLGQCATDSIQVEMITNKTAPEEVGSRVLNDLKTGCMEIEEESENFEFISLVEHVIDMAMEALHDPDSNTRYLAAKQLAGIALKLPQSLSDELLEVVLQLLAQENEASLHSVCLTIGEFCRRGILPPYLLPRVIPVLKQAMLFEEFQGNYSSGSLVRDAACFICWTLAKAFDGQVMREYVQELANSVLICALFDKNSNCRKAAAAGFQESVGRQGYFPNGIAIISEMDYFSVSLRTNAYFRIAPFVGHFAEYTLAFIDHLSTNKLFHVEKEIRTESAKALALLALFAPEYVVQVTLSGLLENCTHKSIQRRCGALVAVASLLMSFSGNTKYMLETEEKSENIFLISLKINDQKLIHTGEYMKEFQETFEKLKHKNILSLIPDDIFQRIRSIPSKIQEAGLLKGKGGEMTRIAIMYLISGVSKAGIPLTGFETEGFFYMIEESLRTTIYDIHDAAVLALSEFAKTYLTEQSTLELKFLDGIIKRIETELIKDIKKSMCRAVACFNFEAIKQRETKVFELLIANSKANKTIKMNDPEIRKYCVKSIGILFLKYSPSVLSVSLAKIVFDLLNVAINDYTVDKRGDIGLVVREEVINSFQFIWQSMSLFPAEHPVKVLLLESYLTSQLGATLTQLVEPNDRLRLKAGFALQQLAGLVPALADPESLLIKSFESALLREKFQNHQDKFFQDYDVSLIDDKNFLSYKLNAQFVYFWNIPRCTFTHIGPLFADPTFNYYLLKGLVLSIASPIEGISSCAYDVLKAQLEESDSLKLLVGANLLKLVRATRSREKFFVGCMKTLQMILKNDLLLLAENDKELGEFLAEVVYHNSKNPSPAKVS